MASADAPELRRETTTRVVTWRAALAGLLAAGVALAFGELPSAFADSSVSQVTAVGNEFVDRFAGVLKDLAVSLFGTNDKPALIVGIIVIALGLGAWFGVRAAHRLWVGALGFFAFGLVGLLSGITDPQMTGAVAFASSLFAVVAGTGALALLVPFAVERVEPAADPAEDPRVRTPDRRAFLSLSGTAGLTAVVASSLSRSLRGNPVEEVRASLTLPTPVDRSAPIPPGADAPFETAGAAPYLTPNRDFYRIDTALTVPRVDIDSWSLRIHGLVDREIVLTYDELLGMDMVERPVTLECVSNEIGGGLVGTARWLGVPLADLLDLAGVQPAGTQIVGRSVDRFTVGMPTDVALDGRTALVAIGMNGEPLPARSGFPARLVVSGLYGYVSATKWLRDIELVRFEDFDAYWVPRGWAKEAPIKLNSRIDVPNPSQTLTAGPVAVAGVAWHPHTGISGVEVRVHPSDGVPGAWEPARLGPSSSDDTWVQWLYEWDARPGQYLLECRAIDADGEVQTDVVTQPRPDGATGLHGVFARVT